MARITMSNIENYINLFDEKNDQFQNICYISFTKLCYNRFID